MQAGGKWASSYAPCTAHSAERQTGTLPGRLHGATPVSPTRPPIIQAEHVYIADVEFAFIDFDCCRRAAPVRRARLIERLQRVESVDTAALIAAHPL
jgi:hypothetical protein